MHRVSTGSVVRARRLIALCAIVALVPWHGIAGDAGAAGPVPAGAADLSTADASRWIVQLRTPALAASPEHRRDGARRLDLGAPASLAYLSRLEAEQAKAIARVRALVPHAQVQRSYRVVLNGFAVAMRRGDAERIRRLPFVDAVTPDMPFARQMDATPSQIAAPALWSRLGGVRNAGEGVKVAIIDSGVYVTKDARGRHTGNACFDGAGYRMPAGYPKGDTRFTNAKVIVARAYFRPGDPPIEADGTPVPGEAGHSHGSHVGGTVACNAGTRASYQGAAMRISGVAPRARLMNYRVFYTSQSEEDFQNGNAYTVELVAAIEDAVSDGADVISNSWGSSYQNTRAWPDPMVRAAEAATDAGVVMVFAQGNSGPAQATGNSPANSPKVIAVGAVTKRTVVAAGDVAVPGGPETLAAVPVGPALFGPSADSAGPASYVPVESVALDQSPLGCSLEGDASPYPPAALTGSIALIERGVCAFSETVFNAQRAGAIAAIVFNTAGGGDVLQAMPGGAHAAEITIPSWFMRRSSGLAMREHRASSSSAQASFAKKTRIVANPGDVLASFSSFGPTQDQILKPDVVAPGVNVLSAGYGGGGFPTELQGFGAVSGTSMATPHVAGAAALLIQAHPEWTPAQVKSALMSTATESVFTDSARESRVGVLGRGAGEIHLARAVNPGLTFDRPSLSAGNLPPGRAVTLRVTASDVSGLPGVWRITSSGTKNLAIRPSTASLVVSGRGATTFDVTLSTPSNAEPGVYEGAVVLTGKTFLHIPVYLRVVPRAAVKDVLLVDDDGSSADPTLLDVRSFYTAPLDALGLTYDVVDVWNDGFPNLEKLFEYRLVLLFTGNNASFDTSGFSFVDQDVLAQWLDGGGRLLATGQNLAETTDSSSFTSSRIGRARLYHGYLGVLLETPDTFGSAMPPSPSAQGENLMTGLTVDLSPAEGGLPNQSSVEATAPMFDNDSYQAPETLTRWFTPLGGNAPAGAGLSFGRSSEPSLAAPLAAFAYRSASFGFGLEGIHDAAMRDELLGRAVRWLLDDVRVTLTATAGPVTTFRAAVSSSSRASIKTLRWDFGDGSRAVTGGPRMSHRYAPGTYTVRVEATDGFGHRSVATRRITVG